MEIMDISFVGTHILGDRWGKDWNRRGNDVGGA